MDWSLVLGIVNLVLVLALWHKTQIMTKLLFLLGAKAGWCDENGRPID